MRNVCDVRTGFSPGEGLGVIFWWYGPVTAPLALQAALSRLSQPFAVGSAQKTERAGVRNAPARSQLLAAYSPTKLPPNSLANFSRAAHCA